MSICIAEHGTRFFRAEFFARASRANAGGPWKELGIKILLPCCVLRFEIQMGKNEVRTLSLLFSFVCAASGFQCYAVVRPFGLSAGGVKGAPLSLPQWSVQSCGARVLL